MDKTLFPMLTEEDRKLPFYLTSVGVRENQEHVQRPEGFPGFHWLHCTKGKGQLNIAGKDLIVREGMGFFFSAGIPHEYYGVAEPWETHWITFEGYALPQLLELLLFDSWEVFHLKDVQQLDRLLFEIFAAGSSKSPTRSYDCSALIYQFILLLKKLSAREMPPSKPSAHQQLQPVVLFMESNYHKDVSLAEMADIIGVTPQHLCRLFKQHYLMRPFEYMTGYRLQKAKELMLGSPALTIMEVAKETGYNDASYFCAVFKEYEGVTPREFKRMYING